MIPDGDEDKLVGQKDRFLSRAVELVVQLMLEKGYEKKAHSAADRPSTDGQKDDTFATRIEGVCFVFFRLIVTR